MLCEVMQRQVRELIFGFVSVAVVNDLNQDELERQQVHLREADREKTRAVQELSEQNQRLLDQLSRVSHKLRIYGIKY